MSKAKPKLPEQIKESTVRMVEVYKDYALAGDKRILPFMKKLVNTLNAAITEIEILTIVPDNLVKTVDAPNLQERYKNTVVEGESTQVSE